MWVPAFPILPTQRRSPAGNNAPHPSKGFTVVNIGAPQRPGTSNKGVGQRKKHTGREQSRTQTATKKNRSHEDDKDRAVRRQSGRPHNGPHTHKNIKKNSVEHAMGPPLPPHVRERRTNPVRAQIVQMKKRKKKEGRNGEADGRWAEARQAASQPLFPFSKSAQASHCRQTVGPPPQGASSPLDGQQRSFSFWLATHLPSQT